MQKNWVRFIIIVMLTGALAALFMQRDPLAPETPIEKVIAYEQLAH